MRISRAYLRISDHCSVTVRATVRVRNMVRVSIRVRVSVRVADCCIQTAGNSDIMRINHVIKIDQWRSAPQIRILPCARCDGHRTGLNQSREKRVQGCTISVQQRISCYDDALYKFTFYLLLLYLLKSVSCHPPTALTDSWLRSAVSMVWYGILEFNVPLDTV